MKKYLLLSVILFGSATVLFAQKDAMSDAVQMFNPVMTGVTSLTIAPDSRAGAMGDVGVATDPDVNSQYWNPAKYPFAISPAGLSLAYTPWLRQLVSDIDLANLVGYYRIGDYQAVSGSLTYFSLGEVWVGDDAASYTIKPYEMAVDFAYSRMLSETFSAAVGLRYIVSDLNYNFDEDTSVGQAFAADISMFYSNYIFLGRRECMVNLGLNASNIGSKISYDGGETNQFIPTNLRLGASVMIPVDEYNVFSISADVNKLMVPTKPTYSQFLAEHGLEDPDGDFYRADYENYLSDIGYNGMGGIEGIFKSFTDAPGGFKEELQEVYWGVGVEYAYNNQFFLRGGYHYENEYKGNRKYFTLGTGFKMSVFSLDAAYLISMAQSNPLDQTLRFTLSFDMDGIREIMGR